MNTGVKELFHRLYRAVSRRLSLIRWSVLTRKDRLERLLRRKKGCEYWDAPGRGCRGQVRNRKSMTAYHWEESSGKPNPNADFLACDEHYGDYYDYWKTQWDEYYSAIRGF